MSQAACPIQPPPAPAPACEPLGHALLRAREQLGRAMPPLDLQARVLAAVHERLGEPVAADASVLPQPHWAAHVGPLPRWPRHNRLHTWCAKQWANKRLRLGHVAGAASMGAALCLVLLLGNGLERPAPSFTDASSRGEPLALAGKPKATQGWGEVAGQVANAGPAYVISKDLPQAQLVGLGVPFDPARAHETVRTEWLVNAKGQVLAVRVAAADTAPVAVRSPAGVRP